MLDAPLPQFFIILQGIAGVTDVSNFKRVLDGFFEFRILCVEGGIVGGDEAPIGGVAQIIGHGVKVGVGVHGEEEQEKRIKDDDTWME